MYVIEIELAEPLTVSVGKLGALDFPAGAYLYVGSARRALPSRVARHMRREKPLRWHIDYLTTSGRVTAVRTWPHAHGRECAIARSLAAHLPAVPRFGCSDCRCQSHLFCGRLSSVGQVTRPVTA